MGWSFWVAGAAVAVAGTIVYLTLPDDSRLARREPSRLGQTLLILGGIRNAILFVVVLALEIAYLVAGNNLGRLIGAGLLVGLVARTGLLMLRRRPER